MATPFSSPELIANILQYSTPGTWRALLEVNSTLSSEATRWLNRYPMLILRPCSTQDPTLPQGTKEGPYPGSVLLPALKDAGDTPSRVRGLTVVADAAYCDFDSGTVFPASLDSSDIITTLQAQLSGQTFDTLHFYYRGQDHDTLSDDFDDLQYMVSRLPSDILTAVRGKTLVLSTSLPQAQYDDDGAASLGIKVKAQFDDIVHIQESGSKFFPWGLLDVNDYVYASNGPAPHLSLVCRRDVPMKVCALEISNLLLQIKRLGSSQSVTLVLDPTSGTSDTYSEADITECGEREVKVAKRVAERMELAGADEFTARCSYRVLGRDEGPEMAKYEEGVRMHRDGIEYEELRARRKAIKARQEAEQGREAAD